MSCRVRNSTRSGFDFRDCKSTIIASHIVLPSLHFSRDRVQKNSCLCPLRARSMQWAISGVARNTVASLSRHALSRRLRTWLMDRLTAHLLRVSPTRRCRRLLRCPPRALRNPRYNTPVQHHRFAAVASASQEILLLCLPAFGCRSHPPSICRSSPRALDPLTQ